MAFADFLPPRPRTVPATAPATEPATDATPDATPEAVDATLLAKRDAADGLSALALFAAAGFTLAAVGFFAGAAAFVVTLFATGAEDLDAGFAGVAALGFAAGALLADVLLAVALVAALGADAFAAEGFDGDFASLDRAAIAGPAPAFAWVAFDVVDADLEVAMDFPSNSVIAAFNQCV